MPDNGSHVEARVGETLSITVPGLKRVSQTGDAAPIDVRGQTLLIQPERAGDTTITVESHIGPSRKFTVDAR